jgi:hypothetical protein
MKKVVALLLIGELFIAFFFLTPFCVLRGEQIHAFAAWHENPTPEAKAELERQTMITNLYWVGLPVTAFCIMASATLVAARLWRKKHPIHLNGGDQTPVI